MKNSFYILIIFSLLLSLSCKKASDKNPLANNNVNSIGDQVSVVTNNMQTKYGVFSSSSSLQGRFTNVNINSLNVEGYNVKENSVGQFFSQTESDNLLERKFPSFYGKSLKILLNGTTMTGVPAVPYANIVDLSNLRDWTISKTNGLKLTWKIYSLASVSDATRDNNMRIDPAVVIPDQIATSKTVVAIVPDDLTNSGGVAQYWEVVNGASTFTIPPSALSMYHTNERINIVVGSGSESSYSFSIGNPVSFTAINTTLLPSLTLEP